MLLRESNQLSVLFVLPTFFVILNLLNIFSPSSTLLLKLGLSKQLKFGFNLKPDLLVFKEWRLYLSLKPLMLLLSWEKPKAQEIKFAKNTTGFASKLKIKFNFGPLSLIPIKI